MARFKKSVLKVDTYRSPDGEVKVTPERLKHWSDTFRAMRAAKLAIPVSWDHSDNLDELVPVNSADKKRSAKNGAGFLSAVDVAADGQSAALTLDIPLEADAEKVRANLAQISPVIFGEWKDGSGKTWSDCFTHVDLVHHPVDASQGAFVEQPAIACALRMGLDIGKPQIYRLSDEDAAPEEFQPKEPDEPAKPEEPENPDLPEASPADQKQQIDAVIAHLGELGIALPSETDATNFFDRVLTALMTAKATRDKAELDAAEDEPEDLDMPNITESSPAFAAMSLQARTAHDYAQRLHQEKLGQRLESLLKTGRCSPIEATERKGLLTAVKLSLGADGKPESSDLEKWLVSREAVPAGTFWDNAQRLAGVNEAKPPSGLIGEAGTPEEVAAIAQWALGKKEKAAAV